MRVIVKIGNIDNSLRKSGSCWQERLRNVPPINKDVRRLYKTAPRRSGGTMDDARRLAICDRAETAFIKLQSRRLLSRRTFSTLQNRRTQKTHPMSLAVSHLASRSDGNRLILVVRSQIKLPDKLGPQVEPGMQNEELIRKLIRGSIRRAIQKRDGGLCSEHIRRDSYAQ